MEKINLVFASGTSLLHCTVYYDSLKMGTALNTTPDQFHSLSVFLMLGITVSAILSPYYRFLNSKQKSQTCKCEQS